MTKIPELLARKGWEPPVDCVITGDDGYDYIGFWTPHMMEQNGYEHAPSDTLEEQDVSLLLPLMNIPEGGIGHAILHSEFTVSVGEILYIFSRFPRAFEMLSPPINDDDLSHLMISLVNGVPLQDYEKLGWVFLSVQEYGDYEHAAVIKTAARAIGMTFDDVVSNGIGWIRNILDEGIDLDLARSVIG